MTTFDNVGRRHYLTAKQTFSHRRLKATVTDGASVVRQGHWDVVLDDDTTTCACCTTAVVCSALWVSADCKVQAAAHKLLALATGVKTVIRYGVSPGEAATPLETTKQIAQNTENKTKKNRLKATSFQPAPPSPAPLLPFPAHTDDCKRDDLWWNSHLDRNIKNKISKKVIVKIPDAPSLYKLI